MTIAFFNDKIERGFRSPQSLRVNLTALMIIVLLLVQPQVAALSQFEYLNVVHRFSQMFLSPSNQEVALSINSTLFAEDVVGRVDLSTNFDGRELSTEYLFGLFVNTAKNKDLPSPYGIPRSYNVTAAVVQHNTISASVVFDFFWPTINQSFPMQINTFFIVNEERQIQAYDATFVRWGWLHQLTDILIPLLVPRMAEVIGQPNCTNATDVVQQYFARDICTVAMEKCVGSDQQYSSYSECMKFLIGIPVGQWYRMGENNLVCRVLHTPMLPIRPSVHCAHVGPSGGDMCVDRDYRQVVLEQRFPQGFLAGKVVTPENRYLTEKLTAKSGTPLSPLLEIAMESADQHTWTMDSYPAAFIVYLVIFYGLANLTTLVFGKYSLTFNNLGVDLQRNVVIYTMNIFITFIAFGFQMKGLTAIFQHYTLDVVRNLRMSGVLITALYLFELIYRTQMRIPLIIHHILTILTISLTAVMFEYTQDPSFAGSALIWITQATTEQLSFIGLLGYRMGKSTHLTSRILKFSSVQTFVVKSASACGLLIWWSIFQNRSDRFMDVIWTSAVWTFGGGLFLTQIWGSYVTYELGRRIGKRDEADYQLVLEGSEAGSVCHHSIEEDV